MPEAPSITFVVPHEQGESTHYIDAILVPVVQPLLPVLALLRLWNQHGAYKVLLVNCAGVDSLELDLVEAHQLRSQDRRGFTEHLFNADLSANAVLLITAWQPDGVDILGAALVETHTLRGQFNDGVILDLMQQQTLLEGATLVVHLQHNTVAH